MVEASRRLGLASTSSIAHKESPAGNPPIGWVHQWGRAVGVTVTVAWHTSDRDPVTYRCGAADAPPAAVGVALVEVRRRLGWSQGTLGERAGLSRAAITHVEGGDPRIDTLHRLAAAMGVPVSVVLTPADFGDPGAQPDGEPTMPEPIVYWCGATDGSLAAALDALQDALGGHPGSVVVPLARLRGVVEPVVRSVGLPDWERRQILRCQLTFLAAAVALPGPYNPWGSVARPPGVLTDEDASRLLWRAVERVPEFVTRPPLPAFTAAVRTLDKQLPGFADWIETGARAPEGVMALVHRRQQ